MKKLSALILIFICNSLFINAQGPSVWNKWEDYSHPALVIHGSSTYISLKNVPAGTSIKSKVHWSSLEEMAPKRTPSGNPGGFSTPNPSDVVGFTPPAENENDKPAFKAVNQPKTPPPSDPVNQQQLDQLQNEIKTLKESINSFENVITNHENLIEELKKENQQLRQYNQEYADQNSQLLEQRGILVQQVETEKNNTIEAERKANAPFLQDWVYTPDHGWLFVDPQNFPIIFKNSTRTWHYYQLGTSKPRNFYNFTEKNWEKWD